jgi:hypothetical protein
MSEKTQMTDDEKIWRLIRIRISQFLHKKTKETGVGILPGTNIVLEIVAIFHPPPLPLRQWPFYLYTVE